MGALKKFFGNWWVLSIGAAVLAALALALLLPMAVAWFRPLWVRLLMVGLVLLVWGGLTAWRMIAAKRANDRIAKELAAVAEDAEGKALTERMQTAMTSLKAASGKQRNYLYSRPWYVIIGPPGAGKSTALVNSGLRFPFSETALKGSGGTRNLDFWFADEAVLVDTAGRYTSQDSDSERDKKAWNAFLTLLKKNRPLQPINGVMIAIGLDELARADVARVDQHASTVRRRLAELRDALEIEVPVYVLFTKADLIAGFSEFYEDLDVEGRRAVLGSTLPWGTGSRPNTEAFTRAFDDMSQAISDRTSKRLQEDMDARRRGLIVGFPAQVQSIRSRIVRFLDGAFPADAPEGAAAIRGFYLTSGVQEGSAIDRVLGSVASLYDQPMRASAQAGAGRAYFINRLLKDVMIPEAGLVSSSKKARARRAAMLTGGLAAVGVVAALVLVAWIVSYFGNRGLQADLLKGSGNMAQELRVNSIDLTEVSEQDPDLEQALSVLNNMRDLPGGYSARRKGMPLTMGFGLFQNSHSRAAEQAYREGLQRILLPRILLRLERVLQDSQADALAAYEPLKVYLMLGGQGPMDRKAVKAWVVNDWEENVFPGMDRQRVRQDLAGHLNVLLEDPNLSSVWPGRRAPLDDALIQTTRAGVQALSMADRAYAVLRQRAAAAGKPDWAASSVMSAGHARAFANGDAVLSQTVPFFFTKAGFEQQYQLGLQNVQRELEGDLWVLGGEQDKAAVRAQMAEIKPGVAGLYAQDYIKAWEGVVQSLQPASYFADPVAASAATSPPSPFKLVLLEVRKNTRFAGGTAMDAAAAAATRSVATKLPGQTAGNLVQERTRQATGLDASRQIELAFVDIHTYVGDGKAPAPIDEFFSKLRAATTAKAAADAAAQSGLGNEAQQVTLQAAMAELAAVAATAPPSAQAFTTPAAQQGGQAQVAAATGAVMGDYDRQVGPACKSVTDGRYPFVAVSQTDAPIGDVLRVFGPGGAVDGYVAGRLMSLMETFGPTWRWKTDSPVTASYDPTSAGEFQRAAEIRDLLASGAPFKVEAVGFGGPVTAAELSIGGQTVKLEPAAPGAKQLQWTVSSLPEAKLTLIEGAKPGQTYAFEGPWAPFRLFDAARKENSGPTAFKATFGEGASYVTLRVLLPSEKNPFSRGGLWSFRCPPRL